MTSSPPAGAAGHATPWEAAAVLSIAAIVALGILPWVWGGIAGLIFGDGWPRSSVAEVGTVIAHLPSHLDDPARAWPARARAVLPHAAGFYLALALLVGGLTALGAGAVRTWRRHDAAPGSVRRSRRPPAASWARRSELRPLIVRAPVPGRLTLGRIGPRLVAAEARQSVIVVAPTQSLKTTGLAIPAVLEWEGPVVATSVKSDL